ncbi:MAG: ankyrin repeat domain-containing protein [Planctomycetaceae bacterium]
MTNSPEAAEWSAELSREINRAYEAGDLAAFSALLRKHPQQLRRRNGTEIWMHTAAQKGKLAFIEALVELGVGVNESEDPPGEEDSAPEGPIQVAAAFGHLDVVRYLLDHGAKINFDYKGKPRCEPLVSAATGGHLEIVKLFVEHGADLKASGTWAIEQAYTLSKWDVYDYLHSLGLRHRRETTPPDYPAAHEKIVAKMTGKFGPLGEWSRTLPGDPEVTLRFIPAAKTYKANTVFTVGLSDRRLPRGRKEFAAGELEIVLPKSWPMDDKSLADPQWNWPLVWLERIVNELRAADRWPDRPVLFPAEASAEPLGPKTKQTAWLCLERLGESVDAPDRRLIDFHTLFPIYPEERALTEREGDKALLAILDEKKAPLHVDPKRKSVVK